MGRKKKQSGKSVSEVGESSGKKQEEVMLAEEDLGDEDNSEKVDTNEGEDESEWYVEWPQLEKSVISHLSFRLKEHLDSAGNQPPPIKEAADVSILVPGCGRSKLSENLYDAGFKNITNLDLSKDVITEMSKKNVRARPEMKWRVMDIKSDIQFPNETFDAIIDQGGLDSLMPDKNLVSLYLCEVKRVLKDGGKYVCLTLAGHLVLDLLFSMFWRTSVSLNILEKTFNYPELQTFMVAENSADSEQKYIDSIMSDEEKKPNFSLKSYAKWPQFEKLLTSHLLFRSEEQLDSAGVQPPPEKKAAEVSILVPGCIKSRLSENLYDAGFSNTTYINFSKSVVSDMLDKNIRVRSNLKCLPMDITRMQFENATFDAVVDKGLLDSLMEPVRSYLDSPYIEEVRRVIKAGGKYVCLTLLADSLILTDILFPQFREGWQMIFHVIGQEALPRDPKLPTFIVIAENKNNEKVYAILSHVGKKPNSNKARVLSKVIQTENKIRWRGRVYSLEDLLLGVAGNLSKLVPGRSVKIIIGRPEGFIYNGVLLDAEEETGPFTYPYAVFLVPQVTDWIFENEEGQWHIVKSYKVARLLMILLERSDLSVADIQEDLSPIVIQLEPEDCGEGFQTPYLREHDEINKKETLYEGSSVLTGPIVVEDVIYKDKDFTGDDDDYKGCTFRRLIFKRNDGVVQTEALLSIKESTDVVKAKIKGKQKISDSQSSRYPVSSGEVKVVHKHLVSLYHRGIVFGIQLVSSYLKASTSARELVNTVVIGLGGGLLPMFMRKYLPFLKIEVVELDRKVLQVARKYFGFSEDESLKVHIRDATIFVKEKADENSSCKIDILVVDVDSLDSSGPLFSPAESFVDESFLLDVKDSLSEKGLFIINLVSPSYRAREEVCLRLKKVFSCILSVLIEQEFHEVMIALKTTGSTIKEDQLCED